MILENANNIKFRASMVHLIMKNGKGKDLMGETCKSYLEQVYREIRYDRQKEVTTKEMEHGIQGEEWGITLFSVVSKKFFKKNTMRIENDFLTGLPDCYIGDSIYVSKEGFDIKCPYTLFTLPFDYDKLDESYRWQNLSYCALTGADKWATVYTLVNHTPTQIDDEKRRWQYKMGVIDPETNEAYKQKCKDIEKGMIYDLGEFLDVYPWYDLVHEKSEWTFDIPKADRVVKFEVQRDDAEIERIYQRVRDCRNYMNETFFNSAK